MRVEFVQSAADEPPFPERSFDRIVSSLLFHHLTREGKRRTALAARRLLRPRGELHVADWGPPHDFLMRAALVPVQLLDGFETTTDNVRGRLPLLLAEAGFVEARETLRRRTAFGSLSLLSAVAP